MKTLVLLATTLAFCTMQVQCRTLAENDDAIADIFHEALENDEGFIDEEPKKREAKGVRKFTGWWTLGEAKLPMTLMVGLDIQNGLIAGEGKVDKTTFSVAGAVESNGKVTFNAVSKNEVTFTSIGMYKDGTIKGKFSQREVSHRQTVLKHTGQGTWEGTTNEGPGTPNVPYKMEEWKMTHNLDENGIVKGTAKDKNGKLAFTIKMDSNNNAELSFHYLQDPTYSWIEKGKFNKELNSFTGTSAVQTWHGNFEVTEA